MTSSPTATATTEGLELSWHMERPEDNQLVVSYRIRNNNDHRVYVCDKLLVRRKEHWAPFPGISLRPLRNQRDTVRMVIGTPKTEVPSAKAREIPPVLYKALEPGEVHRDSRTLGFPLVTHDPLGREQPLPDHIDKAILTVFAIGGEPSEWRELPAADGSSFRVPRGFKPLQLQLSADPLSIP